MTASKLSCAKWRIQDRSLNCPAGKAALRKTMIESVDGALSNVETGITCARFGDLLPDGAITQPNFEHVAIAQRMESRCICQDTDKTQNTNRRIFSAKLGRCQ